MRKSQEHSISLIRKSRLAELLGISVSQLSNLDLPDPIRLGTQARGYRISDIEQWMEENTVTKTESAEVAA